MIMTHILYLVLCLRDIKIKSKSVSEKIIVGDFTKSLKWYVQFILTFQNHNSKKVKCAIC